MQLIQNRLSVVACSASLTLALCCGAAAPRQSPPVPEAVVDLRSTQSAASVGAVWRYLDAEIVTSTNKLPGADLKASGASLAAHDISPRPGSEGFESAAWKTISADELETRRTSGKLAFGWYRLSVTIPESIGSVRTAGKAVVLDVTADDYSEIWVDGVLTPVLGSSGHGVGSGWNTSNRVVIDASARAGAVHDVAIFVSNGPLSAPPTNFVWLRSATLDFVAPERLAGAERVEATITRTTPEFDEVLPRDAVVERLATGFGFIEGPVWVPRVSDGRYGGGGNGGYLLFSDPNQNVIHRYEPLTGTVSVFRSHSGYTGVGGAAIGEYFQPGSNGLALDPQGRLTICEHGNRRVTRLEPNGVLTVLADRDSGKRLNSPNDLVYRSDGAVFFTDPPFGLPKAFEDPRRELAYAGVYVMINGSLRVAATDLKAPNGLAFSPDEKYLYVDNWEESRKVVLRYEVGPDGSLMNPTTFFDMTSTTGEIALDGLKVDAKGNVLISGPGGVWVISSRGQHLGTFSPPELPANFAFGDDDGRTLYMTARTGLYRVRLANPGAAVR